MLLVLLPRAVDAFINVGKRGKQRSVTSTMNFLIDTKGQASLATKDRLLDSDDDDISFSVACKYSR